jgi:hypothetical protein
MVAARTTKAGLSLASEAERMAQVTLSSGLRLLKLQTFASVRAAGWLPWLLVACWIFLAAVQEPTLLRGYRVHLLAQATWVTAIAATGVVSSQVAPSGRTIPYIISVQILTSICALSCVVAFAIAEWGFGRPVAPPFQHLAPMVVTLFPAAACLAVAASSRSVIAWCLLAAVLTLVMTQLPDLGRASWSGRSFGASVAASLSAVALAHVHCQRRA